ncbi:PAS domain-containing sensor histidine kinase [Oxalobacteraceae bacterium OM1]|nr:PAS domain-containing sensor histidine kinase [Oxalobacteraceae bacterium OM1]
MTTHLEHSPAKLPNFITTLPRFPTGKVGPSLLSIIQSAMDGVIVVDAQHQIVLVNQRAERIFGYPAKQLLEKPLDTILPTQLGAEQRRRIERLAATRVNGRRMKVGLKGMHADGTHLSLYASVSRVHVHGESYLALFLHESAVEHAAARNRARSPKSADLRRWAVRSQQVNEVEKRRFSKKLYDDIGQRLSVLKLDLDWLENSLPDDKRDGFPERVAQMQGLLDNVITMTKNVAAALRPPLLDDFGLLPAVEWLAETFQKKTGIPCEVEANSVGLRLGEPFESAIFRVIQEGLTNIEKHSRAAAARVILLLSDTHLDVMIQDDGIGMPEGSENKPGCFGLIAMQERVFVLGGTISIRNAEPAGVVIHAAIPIKPLSRSKS